ncbi:MAG TPA: heparan-alpha-glucosaminide N-acetyltransferase domain-containing protein [Blastocatellia bacterium]|nr:heparan-alpha-glucosaminide N-acetyltransferase domain-containing protein [Blastocatellia bacterium]
MTSTVAQQELSQAEALPKTERLVSLDAFRGLTIAGMILVNNPGSWSYVYAPLAHAEWHGWTPTDLVFPFFLFIVGVSITLSMSGRLSQGGSQRKTYLRILRRTLILFGLGLFLNGFPFFELATLRIPGVLQRIAVCYFFSALIFMRFRVKGQAITAASLLALYWILMKLVPVPGYGAGVLDKDGNLAAYIDNLLMPGHLWKPTWDPEGILSTMPAIATTIFGMLCGHWLRSGATALKKVYGMLAGGLAAVLVGQVMNLWFPINKNLWTSSYTVFTAGMALLFLALCYWVIDYKGYRKPVLPLVIFGVNPITVYVLSGVVATLIDLIRVGAVASDGKKPPLKQYIYDNFFASWAGPWNGSLFFALAFVLLMLIPMWVLYKKRIFIKV